MLSFVLVKNRLLVFSLLFTCLSFGLSAEEGIDDETIPADVALEKARFIERINDESAPPLKRDLFGNKYLFSRQGSCPNSYQDESLSKKVYKTIKSKQRPLISFNEEKLIPFDQGGTCSAMALDFLARYITVCSKKRDPEERRKCVEKFRPFYENNNTAFISRQAAYNTIEVKSTLFASTDEISEQKIQSLANYHGMHLTPVMGSVSIFELENGYDLKSLIDQLPDGNYVVRMLSPSSNKKREYYGHTMVFVKNKDLSIYYDNSAGPLEVTEDLAETVRSILLEWRIPVFRIYHAACKERGCMNLGNDTCQTSRALAEDAGEDSEESFPGISWE